MTDVAKHYLTCGDRYLVLARAGISAMPEVIAKLTERG